MYYVFRRLQQEDSAIVNKHRERANREFYRQMWLGAIVRHSIFALCTIAAGGGLLWSTKTLTNPQAAALGLSFIIYRLGLF